MKKFIGKYINIGQIQHYFLLPTIIKDRPFVLLLHGGPGQSEMMMASSYADIFSEFNLILYDQRGTGKTYRKNKMHGDINLLLKDLKEIVGYIKSQYNIDKIILLGYSWGSVLASLYAKNNPDDLLACIGVGQVVDFQQNETQAYLKLKDQIIKSNNKKDLVKLFKIYPYPLQTNVKAMLKKMAKLRKLQSKYQLALRTSLKDIKSAFFNPYFSLLDFYQLTRGLKRNKQLFSFLINFSLYNYDFEYKVPIYFIMGENDYQTPTSLTNDYFQNVVAPDKGLFILNEVGHDTFNARADFVFSLNAIALRLNSKDGLVPFLPIVDQPYQNP